MLSAESAAIVRATLPVVGASLDAITTRFYETMFAERPELLDGLFNRGNQASGEQRRALAGSIAAFATMLLEKQGPFKYYGGPVKVYGKNMCVSIHAKHGDHELGGDDPEGDDYNGRRSITGVACR
jgi:hemoglobin-like flavoprotein